MRSRLASNIVIPIHHGFPRYSESGVMKAHWDGRFVSPEINRTATENQSHKCEFGGATVGSGHAPNRMCLIGIAMSASITEVRSKDQLLQDSHRPISMTAHGFAWLGA